MTIKFKDNPRLGNVVLDTKVFCKLTKNMPVPSFEYVVGDFNNPKMHGLAGHKWSRLCGFTFKSAIRTDNPIFQFVYVPKLPGPRTHTAQGLHGWYCWRYIANDNRDVVSIEDMMHAYKFSINEFVHSDMFEKYVPMFVSNVQYALSHQVQELLDKTTSPELRRQLMLTIKNIKGSLEHIYDVQTFVTYDDEYDDKEGTYAVGSAPKAGHARIAYNADKTYGLKNLDKDQQAKDKSKVEKLANELKNARH